MIIAESSRLASRLCITTRIHHKAYPVTRYQWARQFTFLFGHDSVPFCGSSNHKDGFNKTSGNNHTISRYSSQKRKWMCIDNNYELFISRNFSASTNHNNGVNINTNNAKFSSDASISNNRPMTTTTTRVDEKSAKHGRNGTGRVKEFAKKYGVYFVGTYFTIYCATLSGFYAALDSGFMDPSTITTFWGGELGDGGEEVDAVKMVANLLEKWEWTQKYSEHVEKNPQLTALGIAWLGVKIIEPLRFGASFFFTPKVAKMFGKRVIEEENSEEVSEQEPPRSSSSDRSSVKIDVERKEM